MIQGIEPYDVFEVKKVGTFTNTLGERFPLKELGFYWQDVFGDVAGAYPDRQTAEREASQAGERDIR